MPLQVPAAHEMVAMLAGEQARAQAPQFCASSETGVSQPLFLLSPSQSSNPGLQTPLQTVPEHAGVTWLVEHGASHSPQCAALVAKKTSQPVAAMPSQSPYPAKQIHAPPLHLEAASDAQSVPPLSQPEPFELQLVLRESSQPGWSGVQIRVRHVVVASSQY